MKKIKINLFLSCLIALVLLIASFSLTFAAEGGVKNVKLTPGATSVKVSWSKYNGAKYYTVYYAGKETNYATGTSCTIKGLSVDTQYGFRVKAYDSKKKLIGTSFIAKTKTLGVKNVTNFKANAGRKSITLTFDKVPGATCYELYRKDNKTGKWKILKQTSGKYKGKNIGYGGANSDTKYNKNRIFFKDTGADERNVAYFYRVRAIKNRGGGKYWVSPKYSKSSARPVRQMYVEIKVNGRWHTANAFSGGKYYTLEGDSYSFGRASRAIADYSENSNYTNRTAENFVNEMTQEGKITRGSNKYMIWVSTYTQHVYVFHWTKNGWRIHGDKQWECASGEADSPTPTSQWAKDIDHKHYQRSASYYWNCFQTHNAIHAKPSGTVIDGAPHSHGCVRSPRDKAIWVYENLDPGTPVLSW